MTVLMVMISGGVRVGMGVLHSGSREMVARVN
jgi:hypothetical protein